MRRILERIASGAPGNRETAFLELLILSGLRKLDEEVRREAKRMPILNDIMDHSVLGPVLRQGRAEGKAEGRAEGQLELLLGQAEKRFGKLSADTRQRMASLKPTQLKRVGLRLLDAKRIEDLRLN